LLDHTAAKADDFSFGKFAYAKEGAAALSPAPEDNADDEGYDRGKKHHWQNPDENPAEGIRSRFDTTESCLSGILGQIRYFDPGSGPNGLKSEKSGQFLFSWPWSIGYSQGINPPVVYPAAGGFTADHEARNPLPFLADLFLFPRIPPVKKDPAKDKRENQNQGTY